MQIRHIGVTTALCNKNIPANLRIDLGYDRYKGLGVEERFRDEKPYRICKLCLAKIKKNESK